MSATQSSFSSDRPLLGRARLILKGIHFAGVLLLGVVLLPSVALLGRHAKHLINWWLGRMLAALAVDVELDGQAPAAPMLVVANHCSWLDILVLGWAFNTAFVSKAEVGKWDSRGCVAAAHATVAAPREECGGSGAQNFPKHTLVLLCTTRHSKTCKLHLYKCLPTSLPNLMYL